MEDLPPKFYNISTTYTTSEKKFIKYLRREISFYRNLSKPANIENIIERPYKPPKPLLPKLKPLFRLFNQRY